MTKTIYSRAVVKFAQTRLTGPNQRGAFNYLCRWADEADEWFSKHLQARDSGKRKQLLELSPETRSLRWLLYRFNKLLLVCKLTMTSQGVEFDERFMVYHLKRLIENPRLRPTENPDKSLVAMLDYLLHYICQIDSESSTPLHLSSWYQAAQADSEVNETMNYSFTGEALRRLSSREGITLDHFPHDVVIGFEGSPESIASEREAGLSRIALSRGVRQPLSDRLREPCRPRVQVTATRAIFSTEAVNEQTPLSQEGGAANYGGCSSASVAITTTSNPTEQDYNEKSDTESDHRLFDREEFREVAYELLARKKAKKCCWCVNFFNHSADSNRLISELEELLDDNTLQGEALLNGLLDKLLDTIEDYCRVHKHHEYIPISLTENSSTEKARNLLRLLYALEGSDSHLGRQPVALELTSRTGKKALYTVQNYFKDSTHLQLIHCIATNLLRLLPEQHPARKAGTVFFNEEDFIHRTLTPKFHEAEFSLSTA